MQQRFPNHDLTINTIYFEASAYFALEKYSQAREVLQKIIKLNKSAQLTEIATYQIAESYYFAKDLKTSIPLYDQYVKQYPDGKFVARALYMQGNCFVTLEQFDKAKDKFGQVIAKFPDFEEICVVKNYMAFSLNRIDKWKDAVQYYQQVIKNNSCNKKTVDFAKEQLEAIRASRM